MPVFLSHVALTLTLTLALALTLTLTQAIMPVFLSRDDLADAWAKRGHPLEVTLPLTLILALTLALTLI